MNTRLRHVACKYRNPLAGMCITPLDGMQDPDPVHCIYCGTWMDEYDGDGLWDLPKSKYMESHRQTAKFMIQQGFVPDSDQMHLEGTISDRIASLLICPSCAWWAAVDRAIFPARRWQMWSMTLISGAVIRDLDIRDISAPMTEVRRFLTRNRASVSAIHPRLFENVVASVFRDHGYATEVTAYSSDGGIDVVLRGPDNIEVGMQVKRRKRSIEVEQIRSFLGALTLGNYRKGVFVATSSFQKGAVDAARLSTTHYVPIELIDARGFFDLLRVAQLNNPVGIEECGFEDAQKLRFSLHSNMHLNSL